MTDCSDRCKWKECCKAFWLRTYGNSEAEDCPPHLIPDLLRELSVKLPERNKVTRYLCVLQDYGGECLVHSDKPKICGEFQCEKLLAMR